MNCVKDNSCADYRGISTDCTSQPVSLTNPVTECKQSETFPDTSRIYF